MSVSPCEHLGALGAFLGGVSDIVRERVLGPEPPRFCVERGWTSFLLSLDDDALARIEHGDIARELAMHESAPDELRAIAAQAIELTRVPRASTAYAPSPLRKASERKREQVAALGALASAWAPGARRIVDLGAGHGHLTRELAAALRVDAIGIEQRAHVVDNARALTGAPGVRFVVGDALGVELGPHDLAVGLHACGALGDALVRAAAERGAGVLLVSCCPQKIDTPLREPLSRAGSSVGLVLAREHLGLANLATLAHGGIDSGGVTARRRTRHALWLLLRDAGVALAPGDEADGVQRRQFRRPLAEVAARAFAKRGLAAPSASAITDAEERAAREHDRARRFALPRTMLARALELALVLDRAALLEESGGAPPQVLEAFDRRASPRNLAIVRAPARA